MATRRVEPNLTFDHGAQYFTARDRNFTRYVQAWIQQGTVAEWAGRIVEVEGTTVRPQTDQPNRYVGVPGMQAVADHLAKDLSILLEKRIVRVERIARSWELTAESHAKYGAFDYLIVALPSPQAAVLLGDHPLASEARTVPMVPCWAVMAAFESPVQVPWDAAFVRESPLAWVARNSRKPGRDPNTDCWVLHASADWSAVHRDDTQESATKLLLEEFANLTCAAVPTIVHHIAHRWLYSSTPLLIDQQVLFDPHTNLMACGDWLAGGRVEGAFGSGIAAAGCVLRSIGIPWNAMAYDSLATDGAGR